LPTFERHGAHFREGVGPVCRLFVNESASVVGGTPGRVSCR
jgi:hypothetical protein